VVVQEGATAPGSFARDSEGPPCGACSSEGKKKGGSQGKRRSQKTETCRREEEEKTVGVPPTTLGQSVSRRRHFIGGH